MYNSLFRGNLGGFVTGSEDMDNNELLTCNCSSKSAISTD
jgi:hypothetical protein